MTDLKAVLIEKARARHGRIYPVAGRSRIEDCFTNDGGKLILWYNDEKLSTHIVSAPTHS